MCDFPSPRFPVTTRSRFSSWITVKCMVLTDYIQADQRFHEPSKTFPFSSFPPLYFVQPLELYNSQETIFFFFLAENCMSDNPTEQCHPPEGDTGNRIVCKGRNCHILNGVSLQVWAGVYLHTYCSSHTSAKLSCFMKFRSWMFM